MDKNFTKKENPRFGDVKSAALRKAAKESSNEEFLELFSKKIDFYFAKLQNNILGEYHLKTDCGNVINGVATGVVKINKVEITGEHFLRYGSEYRIAKPVANALMREILNESKREFLDNQLPEPPQGYLKLNEFANKSGVPVKEVAGIKSQFSKGEIDNYLGAKLEENDFQIIEKKGRKYLFISEDLVGRLQQAQTIKTSGAQVSLAAAQEMVMG